MPGADGAAATSGSRRGGVVADLAVGVVIRGQRSHVTGLASQFAYNAFISTVPLLIVVISAIGLLGGNDAPKRIISTYRHHIPEAYSKALDQLLTSAVHDPNRAAVFLALGVMGALYLVGNALGALMVGLDRSRGVPHRSWVHGKIVGIKFAAIWAVLMTAMNVLLLAGQDMVDWAVRNKHLNGGAGTTADNILFPTVTLVLLAMVWVLYRWGPNAQRRRFVTYLPGILVAAIGIIVFTQLFGLYVQHFGALAVYGPLVGVVVYLSFLWGVGVALLGGADVNEELLAIRRGHPTRGSLGAAPTEL
ncbi:MAG: YhjD/YihY/BrkB family envelope integrity protein [Thermoleophilia bacterium]